MEENEVFRAAPVKFLTLELRLTHLLDRKVDLTINLTAKKSDVI